MPRKAGHPNTGDLLGSIRTNDGERSLQTPGHSNQRETVQTTPFLRWKRRMVQADFEGAGSLRALSLQRVVPLCGDPFECSQIHNRVLSGTTIQQPSRLESINEGRVPQWPLNSENIST